MGSSVPDAARPTCSETFALVKPSGLMSTAAGARLTTHDVPPFAVPSSTATVLPSVKAVGMSAPDNRVSTYFVVAEPCDVTTHRPFPGLGSGGAVPPSPTAYSSTTSPTTSVTPSLVSAPKELMSPFSSLVYVRPGPGP